MTSILALLKHHCIPRKLDAFSQVRFINREIEAAEEERRKAKRTEVSKTRRSKYSLDRVEIAVVGGGGGGGEGRRLWASGDATAIWESEVNSGWLRTIGCSSLPLISSSMCKDFNLGLLRNRVALFPYILKTISCKVDVY